MSQPKKPRQYTSSHVTLDPPSLRKVKHPQINVALAVEPHGPPDDYKTTIGTSFRVQDDLRLLRQHGHIQQIGILEIARRT